jgi:hypothetical protein
MVAIFRIFGQFVVGARHVVPLLFVIERTKMALLKSLDIPLGTPLIPFELNDPHGKITQSATLMGSKGLLVAFTCNHCPYALAIWPRLLTLAHHAKTVWINTVAINPNIHPDYPEDSPEKMVEKIKEWKISFPYLVDASQLIAQKYQAQCTPDLYLFDSHPKLVYHGRIDDNWQDETKVTRHELREAIDHLAHGKIIDAKQYPSMGCSIKWR